MLVGWEIERSREGGGEVRVFFALVLGVGCWVLVLALHVSVGVRVGPCVYFLIFLGRIGKNKA